MRLTEEKTGQKRGANAANDHAIQNTITSGRFLKLCRRGTNHCSLESVGEARETITSLQKGEE